MIKFLEKYKGFDVVLFFAINDGKKYSINQVSRMLNISLGSSKNICNALQKEDFLDKEIIGRSHLYSLNQNNINSTLLKKIAFPYFLSSEEASDFFKKINEKIMSVYLYGSCAIGNYDSKSDIDLFLLTINKMSKEQITKIRNFLIKMFFDRNIQLSIYSLLEFKKLQKTVFFKEVKKGIKIFGEDI